jgi:hypothetical protein
LPVSENYSTSWKQNFSTTGFFLNWQHWSSPTIPSIWLGGLRVGPIPSTGAYGPMSLFLLILRDALF